MRSLRTAALSISLLFFAPALARADDSSSSVPSPMHGGRVIVMADATSRFEVVHDSREGTVTVYALEEKGKAPMSFSKPTLVLSTKDGPREIALASLSGSTNAWRVSDDDLKGSSLSASLRVRIGDKDVEGSLFAASAPEEPAVPGIPARFEQKFEPAHGGHVLMAGDHPFEWVHDATLGTLTVYAVSEGEGKTPPVVSTVTVNLGTDASPKELTLSPLADTPSAWRITDAALKTAFLEGTVRLTMDGKPIEGRLVARGSHGGRILSLGTDAPFLEMKHDLKNGTLTVYVIQAQGTTFADSSSALAGAPTLDLVTATGTKTLTLSKAEGEANAWTAKDAFLGAKGLRGVIHLRVGDKSFDAQIDRPEAKTREPAPAGK